MLRQTCSVLFAEWSRRPLGHQHPLSVGPCDRQADPSAINSDKGWSTPLSARTVVHGPLISVQDSVVGRGVPATCTNPFGKGCLLCAALPFADLVPTLRRTPSAAFRHTADLRPGFSYASGIRVPMVSDIVRIYCAVQSAGATQRAVSRER